ncbi:glutathione S-transferase T3-like [Rutidosis leptorrhynchoides]|uniref:glutathione S-transferase T3-like n=1 Tax=Rutidosis leptorrhynchoides TaxID=125765 RepID=UPI003A99FA86
MWSKEESRILAECWARASQNNIIRNSHTTGTFWSTVLEDYNSLVTEPRRQDQLTGKWSKMCKDIKIFIGIYEKLKLHWQSGQNDADVMKHAKKGFKLQRNRVFAYEEAWSSIKDCPHFLTYDGFNNKRAQSDSINLEDSDPTPTPPRMYQTWSLFSEEILSVVLEVVIVQKVLRVPVLRMRLLSFLQTRLELALLIRP